MTEGADAADLTDLPKENRNIAAIALDIRRKVCYTARVAVG